VLHRAAAAGELTKAEAADRWAHLAAAAARWNVLPTAAEVVERSREPFRGGPIRTLDAVPLASALVARSAVAGLELLSLDERIRKAAGRLRPRRRRRRSRGSARTASTRRGQLALP
jgi:hypothetical protein